MSRPVLAALLLLWTPQFVSAQAAETKPVATQQDPEVAYKELAKSFNKTMSEWQAEAQKAQAAGTAIPAAPNKEFISRAQELANEYAGKDDAVQFLTFICKNSGPKERNAIKKAVQTLATDHAMSPAIGKALVHLEMAALRFGAKDTVLALLDEVTEKHADAECQAQARLSRGTIRLQAAQNDDERKVAELDLRKVAAEAKNEDIAKQAKEALFEIDNLSVGCTAPDIAAKDTDGVDFKLSDYRGKVVLLDFWGFW